MGINLPIAHIYMNDYSALYEMGVEGSKGLIHIDAFDMPNPFKTPGYVKFFNGWQRQWKTWKTAPYNSRLWEYLGSAGNASSLLMSAYWLLNVIERAQSTDPEKIIKIWEGDTYRYVNGKVVKMRACDHKAIMDLSVSEYVPPEQQRVSMSIPPYYWFKEIAYTGPIYRIPAEKILPWMDPKLERCKGKNGWGN